MEGEKPVAVLLIISFLVISGCFGNQNNELLLNEFSIEEYVEGNLTLTAEIDNHLFYPEDEIIFNLTLLNKGIKDVKVNDFNKSNIFLEIDSERHFIGCYDPVKILSQKGRNISNSTWSPDLSMNCTSNSTIMVKFDLRNILVYYTMDRSYDYHSDWMTIDEYIWDHLNNSFLDSFMNITFCYIPTSNRSVVIRSDPIEIHFTYRATCRLDFERTYHNEMEKKVLDFTERIDYVNYTGSDRYTEDRYQKPMFIDHTLINRSLNTYYRFENDTDSKCYYSFMYEAEVFLFNNISFENGSYGVDLYHNGEEVSSIYLFRETSFSDEYFTYFCNQSALMSINGSCKDHYLIHMYYDEFSYWGRLAGAGSDICQEVILSSDLEVIYIWSRSTMILS